MSPFTGRAIGLAFAALWLLLGAAALPGAWHYIALTVGLVALALLALRAWRMGELRNGLFRMQRYWTAVVAEFAAIALVTSAFNRAGLGSYLIPVVGILVGLHFIGLWWAGGGTQYLWLAGGMSAINAVALLLPPGGNAMQALAGLGSAAALGLAAGTGARR